MGNLDPIWKGPTLYHGLSDLATTYSKHKKGKPCPILGTLSTLNVYTYKPHIVLFNKIFNFQSEKSLCVYSLPAHYSHRIQEIGILVRRKPRGSERPEKLHNTSIKHACSQKNPTFISRELHLHQKNYN